MPNTKFPQKLVLFVINCFWTTNGNALASTIPLIMDKEDKSVEYAAIMIVSDSDKASRFRIAAEELVKNRLQDMAFIVPYIPPKCPISRIVPEHLSDYIKSFVQNHASRYEKFLIIQLPPTMGEIEIGDAGNAKVLTLGIGLYPREFKNFYFDLLGYDGNCGNGYDTDSDFCKELVTRSLPEIKECIRRLLNGDDIPHQTFTDDIEPYKMYEGH